jgi:hypothetical protein
MNGTVHTEAQSCPPSVNISSISCSVAAVYLSAWAWGALVMVSLTLNGFDVPVPEVDARKYSG